MDSRVKYRGAGKHHETKTALPELYTAKEVAQAFKMSPHSVRTLVHRGQLAAVQFGDGKSGIRFTLAAVQAFIEKQRMGPRWLANGMPRASQQNRQGGEREAAQSTPSPAASLAEVMEERKQG